VAVWVEQEREEESSFKPTKEGGDGASPPEPSYISEDPGTGEPSIGAVRDILMFQHANKISSSSSIDSKSHDSRPFASCCYLIG
jgi:hypothetical protein